MKVNVLLVSSSLKNQGGIISVLKNYLSFDQELVDFSFLASHRDGSIIRKYLYFIFAIIRLPFMLLFRKIDIVHMHISENGSVWRAILLHKICKLFNKPVIVHHHAAEFDDFYFACNKKKRKKIDKFLESVNTNVVLSKRLIPMIKDKAPNSKVIAIRNSVYTYKNNMYSNRGKTILFLGRLGRRKGTYDLIDVIKDLDNVIDKDVCFALCGDGEITEVKNIITALDISHRISHIGWIDKEDKKRILEDTLINVLPSYNEGLPMTILETMALGIPNISTNIASIPDVIDNATTGFLINPGDKNALKEKILFLINDANARLEISNNSFKFINDNFSFGANFKELIKLYKEVLR